LNDLDRKSAEQLRSQLGRTHPADFRAGLLGVAPVDRDAWLDLALGLEEIPDDGAALPRGCTPYLPCSVDALLRIVELAEVRASDVFVDLGAGVGRAAALVHLLTGAAVVGVEIQPHLAASGRALAERLRTSRVASVEGDVVDRAGFIASGTVFFLYAPFGGDRLERVLDDLEAIARTRTIRIGCVDLPLPPRDWLTLETASQGDVTLYRSTT
jgi:SAM-dependent methyltransferase